MPRWSKDPRDKLKVGRGTLRKRVRGKVWYYQHRDADGHWTVVSTHHSDKPGAIEWATAWSMKIVRAETGVVDEDEKVSNQPILPAFDEYLEYIKEQRKPSTLKTYRSVKKNLAGYLEARPTIRRLDQFDTAEGLGFRDWLRRKQTGKKGDRQNSKKTADNNLVVMRAFFNWAVELKKMRANPIRESKHGVQLFYNERRPGIETYTRAEYAAIVKHAPPDVKLKVMFLAASGVRIDEAAHLETTDVDMERGWLHVRAKTTHNGERWSPKDDEDRRLPLNVELRAVIAELLPTGTGGAARYLFPTAPGPWRAKNFGRTTLTQLKRLAEPTSIPPAKLTSHNFRRYFVSQCADCGIDILCVMEWVGHSDWEMVRRYYRLRDEHAVASMAKFTTGTPGGAERHGSAPSGKPGTHMGHRSRKEQRSPRHRKPQPLIREKVAAHDAACEVN
jgi:integrase